MGGHFEAPHLLVGRLSRRGTFASFLRASLSPMAIACLRLVTRLPLRPLLSVPLLRRRIADLTIFARALAVPRHLRHLLMRVFPVDASREYCKPCAHGWRRGKVSA